MKVAKRNLYKRGCKVERTYSLNLNSSTKKREKEKVGARDTQKVVLRVVVPNAYLKPELPLIDYELLSMKENISLLVSYYKVLFPNDKTLFPDDKPLPDYDNLFKKDKDLQASLIQNIKHLEHQFALADGTVRIGLCVRFFYDLTKDKEYTQKDEKKTQKLRCRGDGVLCCPPSLSDLYEKQEDNDKYNENIKNNDEHHDVTGCCGLIKKKGKNMRTIIPPVTKYGLTYFPCTYRFEFTDLDRSNITNNSGILIDFYAIHTDGRFWLICTGSSKDLLQKNKKKPDIHNKEDLKSIGYKEDYEKDLEDSLKLLDIQIVDKKKNDEESENKKHPDKKKKDEKLIEFGPWLKDNEANLVSNQMCKFNFELKSHPVSVFFEADKKIKRDSQKKDTDSQESNKESKISSWAKVTAIFLTAETAELNKWSADTNEYPILPSHGIEEVVISDSFKTFQSILQFWKDRDDAIKVEAEQFALRQCKPANFSKTLATCLKYAADPIATAMRGAAIADERLSAKSSSGVDWELEKKKAETYAVRLAELIPNQMKKLHMTSHFSEAAKVMLDENLDMAVDEQYNEICRDPVFMERLNSRWMHIGLKKKGLNPLERIPPCYWYVAQLISYIIYLGLLSYSTSSTGGTFVLNYKSNLENNYFDDNYNNIADIDSFWFWMNNTFNTETFPVSLSEKFTDHEWVATPSVILRQIRVAEKDSCYLSSFNITCYPSIDVAAATNKIYGINIPMDEWQGTSWEDNVGIPLHGLHFGYPSGGYIARLSGDQGNVSASISQLKDSGWVDVATRAIIVEFAIYNLDGNLYTIFTILLEFTHLNVVNLMEELTIIDNRSFNPDRGDWVILLMVLFTIGLIVQEGCEMLVTGVYLYDELKKSLPSDKKIIYSTYEGDIQKLDFQFDTNESCWQSFKWANIKESGSEILPVWMQAFIITLYEQFTDFWNILDAVTNTAMFIYVILFCITTISTSPVRIQEPTDVDIHHLWNLEYLIETAHIFGSVGVIIGYVRFLYFFLPFHAVGPLVLSMLWMYVDVVYFISLLCVMILGFAAAFNLLYGGIVPQFTGFGISVFTCITVAYNTQFNVPNDEFVPLPVPWVGNIVMLVYFVLSAILLVNLLIAMMGTTYNEKMTETRPVEGEWSASFGDLLLHYERFLLLPPPLNLLQVLAFCLCALITGFQKDKFSWLMFGSWTSRDRLIQRLLRKKLSENHKSFYKSCPCCGKDEHTDDNDNNKGPSDDNGPLKDDKEKEKETKEQKEERLMKEIEESIKIKEDKIWEYIRNICTQYNEKKKKQKIRSKIWRSFANKIKNKAEEKEDEKRVYPTPLHTYRSQTPTPESSVRNVQQSKSQQRKSKQDEIQSPRKQGITPTPRSKFLKTPRSKTSDDSKGKSEMISLDDTDSSE